MDITMQALDNMGTRLTNNAATVATMGLPSFGSVFGSLAGAFGSAPTNDGAWTGADWSRATGGFLAAPNSGVMGSVAAGTQSGSSSGQSGGTQGIRLNGTAAFGLGVTMALGVHKDSHGEWDVQFSFAKTTALPGASVTLGYTHTTANSVKDLTGWGAAVGVSGGMVAGGEANFVFGSSYKGGDYGVGVSTPGITPQVTIGYTWSLRVIATEILHAAVPITKTF